MHPSHFAKVCPDRPAHVMASTGEAVTYRELDARSNQGARLFRALGLNAGDTVGICMENNLRYLEIAWAAQKSGLYYTCISNKLTASEAAYILEDSGATVFITSAGTPDIAAPLEDFADRVALLMVGGAVGRYKSFENARAAFPTNPIDDETAGADMLYSSGTTGRPKGIRQPLSGLPPAEATGLAPLAQSQYRMDADTIYLSPAPLYHAAPLRWGMAAQRLGGTVVIMDRFDPESALDAIESYRITHAQWVPTHFVRMLKLPDAIRLSYDLSSLRLVFHGAAPCPVPIKQQMIDWWGPIIHEYYGGTESNGFVGIGPEEWLAHKGSVGQSIGAEIKICGEDGEALPPRTEGTVFFAGGAPLNYHNAPEKVAEGTNKYGWTTLGDVGWVDEDGFLYLTDRKSFMIISGGVNIYPQELENLLITHPKVADAAVVGAPHEEMGEQVVAVVQPMDWAAANEDLKAELSAFCRARLSHVKSPRIIDFMQELPRHPTGKLYKRLIRDAYWSKEQPRLGDGRPD